MTSRFWKIASAALAFATLSAAPAAQAGFIGNEVTFSLLFPGPAGSVEATATSVIANGTRLGPIYKGQVSATFGDDTVLLGDFLCCTWVPGVYFVISGADLGIRNVTIDASSNQPGLDSGDITFDANHIYIDAAGHAADPRFSYRLDVDFASEVPEPGSPILVGAAALALAALRRRKGRDRHMDDARLEGWGRARHASRQAPNARR